MLELLPPDFRSWYRGERFLIRFTVLDYATTYYWKVVAYNDIRETQNRFGVEFYDACRPNREHIPWSEGFKDDIFPPLGWKARRGYTASGMNLIIMHTMVKMPVYISAGLQQQGVLQTPNVRAAC